MERKPDQIAGCDLCWFGWAFEEKECGWGFSELEKQGLEQELKLLGIQRSASHSFFSNFA
jgi:hypothetical protein